MNSVERGPLPRKVSQTWLSREKALTAANEKLVEPAGILWTTWYTVIVGMLRKRLESNER